MLYNFSMGISIDVPTIPKRTVIPREAIQKVVDQIVRFFNPEKIILIGSYAWGTPGPESDVDILVVMDTEKSELEQSAMICRKISYRFALDLIVVSPKKLSSRITLGDSFLKEISVRGIILYESAHD